LVNVGLYNSNFRVQTNSGTIDIGPTNTGYCHISTDRSQFYFNQKILINGGELSAYGATQLKLSTDSGANEHIFADAGTTTQVGIGNSSPGYTLDVDGIIRSSGGIRLDPIAYSGVASSGSSGSTILTIDMQNLSYKNFTFTNTTLGRAIVGYQFTNAPSGAQAVMVVFNIGGGTCNCYGHSDPQYTGSVFLGWSSSVTNSAGDRTVITFTKIGSDWYANAAVYDT